MLVVAGNDRSRQPYMMVERHAKLEHAKKERGCAWK